jgi:hypothetical protein
MWDPLSSALSLVDFGSPWEIRRFGPLHRLFRAWTRVRRAVFLLKAVLGQLRWQRHDRLPDSMGASYSNFALGYYIHGIR